jgi:hypothetical protein
MSSFRFRAANSFSRGSKNKSRFVERLEPRCVLSSIALYAPPALTAVPHFGFSDDMLADHSAGPQIRFSDPQINRFSADSLDRLAPDMLGHRASTGIGFGASHDLAFGAPEAPIELDGESPRLQIAEFFAEPPMVPQEFYGLQHEIIVIYASSPSVAPNNYSNYVDVSAPAAYNAVSPRPDIPMSIAAKPAIAPAADPSARDSLAPASNSTAVPVRSLVAENVPATISNAANSMNVRGIFPAPLSGGSFQTSSGALRYALPLQERFVARTMQSVGFGEAVVAVGGMDNGAEAAATPVVQTIAGGSTQIVTVAEIADPAQAVSIDVPADRAALAELPLNLFGVEQALKTVMSRIAILGTELNSWLDDAHFAPMIAAVAGAALGAGGACYLRRRSTSGSDEQSEDASSSWLFARLQAVSGE